MLRLLIVSCAVCLLAAGPARAQQQADATSAPAGSPAADQANPPSTNPLENMVTTQLRFEHVGEGHDRLIGEAMIQLPGGGRFFADTIDVYAAPNRIVASGNVVFDSAEGRVSAERVEFNLENGTGTFDQASGIISLGEKASRAQFGNQDPDVYFYGDRIERLGARRYRITRGGFSTCVQPTPRWEVTSGSITLNLDEYAVARNTLLKVKGVPLLYLPILYYPIQHDDRATGFLLPTYGTTRLRGQTISNGFFWAIGRSQDATFFHDWFTKAGQGLGTEYRYIAGPQSSGSFRAYRFSQRQASYTQGGVTATLPDSQSYELTGAVTQRLGSHVRARGRIDYFSDLQTQQLYQQNLYQASRTSRIIEGGVSGTIGGWMAGASYQRNETFSSRTSATLYGSTPRLSASMAPRTLFGSPVYAAVNTEYAFLPYQSINDGRVLSDRGFSRVDVSPTIRVPLSKLPFLSVNASAGYRSTYYSKSADPANASLDFLPTSFFRTVATARADVVGPVLTRIWDLPESSASERLKHVIEPAFSVDVTSPIDEYRRTPIVSDYADFLVGGTSRLTYGVTNRLFSRRRATEGQRSQTREFVTIGLQQTYYSNSEASRFDTAYLSAQSTSSRSFSPVALSARVSPTAAVDANTRVEYDLSEGAVQLFSAGGSLTAGTTSGTLTYSRQHYSTLSDPSSYMSASTRMSMAQGRITGSYALSWDISRGYIVTQSLAGTYLAQCCGVQVEYQNYNYGGITNAPIPADRRLNFSFILAGLGTFSNFFGAFGGGMR